MYILGLSAMGHDTAAALIGDSGVVAAIEESKLARTRTIEGIPRAAIRYCLEHGWNHLARNRACGDRERSLTGLAAAGLVSRSGGTARSGFERLLFEQGFGELGRELNNFRIVKQMAGAPEGRVESLDHHLCHAASAFYASPFERALIVSLDEKGDGRAGFVGVGEGTRIREVSSVAFRTHWRGSIRR